MTLSDVNADMLKFAKEKMIDHNIDDRICNYIVSSAEDFKSIEDNTYDLYVISFGLRNVPNIP